MSYPASTPRLYNRDFLGGMGRVGGERWFCGDAEEWDALAEGLKQIPCPHCKEVGMLIRHGYLHGFDDSSPPRETVRARRIFCSNRNARRGCGRTFSVWIATTIRRLSLSSATVWRFLQRVVAGGIVAAIRAADCQRSDRTWQRIWTRFNQGQSKIRTALSARCPPPEPAMPAAPPAAANARADRPAAHVLAHLRAAFPGDPCPIASFQHTLRTFFI